MCVCVCVCVCVLKNLTDLFDTRKCSSFQVTEHGGTWADKAAYLAYTHTGGIAYLLPNSDNFTYDFTILEIYGGAHLTVSGTGTKVKAVQIVGDDTGHLHVAPGHTLEWTQVGCIEQARMHARTHARTHALTHTYTHAHTE